MIKAVDINPVSLHEALNNKIWRSLDKKQFIDLKRSLNLPEYLFIELVMDWIGNVSIQKADILEIWENLDLDRVSPVQVKYIKDLAVSKHQLPLSHHPLRSSHLTVSYTCNIDLIHKLRTGKYASFTYPLSSKPGLNPTLTFRLRLTVERDHVTGTCYETEKVLLDDLDQTHRAVHWFIIGQQSFSVWDMFDRSDKTAFMSLVVNSYQGVCSVM